MSAIIIIRISSFGIVIIIIVQIGPSAWTIIAIAIIIISIISGSLASAMPVSETNASNEQRVVWRQDSQSQDR